MKKELYMLQEDLRNEKIKSQSLLDRMEYERSTQEHLQSLEANSNEILAQLQVASLGLDLKEKTHAVITSK